MQRIWMGLAARSVMFQVALGLTISALAQAAQDDPGYALVILDHRFKPDELIVPAGKKIRLTIDNRDVTPEEFESHALNREKVIAGKTSATIFIGPLQPGRYPFVGEFNEQTAKGVIVAQ